MATLLLVRHGQASWDAEDYDRLSDLGARQAVATGRALAGLTPPSRVISGSMERQRTTAALVTEAAGWSVPVTVDRGWDEFDHLQVLSAHTPPPPEDDHRAVGGWILGSLARWASGENDADYDEPFAVFTSRIDVALRRLDGELEPAGTAVVFTSLGPICWSVSALLGGRPETWLQLAPAVLNASVTRIALGSRGRRLGTFNEHTHLGPELLTFR